MFDKYLQPKLSIQRFSSARVKKNRHEGLSSIRWQAAVFRAGGVNEIRRKAGISIKKSLSEQESYHWIFNLTFNNPKRTSLIGLSQHAVWSAKNTACGNNVSQHSVDQDHKEMFKLIHQDI